VKHPGYRVLFEPPASRACAFSTKVIVAITAVAIIAMPAFTAVVVDIRLLALIVIDIAIAVLLWLIVVLVGLWIGLVGAIFGFTAAKRKTRGPVRATRAGVFGSVGHGYDADAEVVSDVDKRTREESHWSSADLL
jgi:hypothetical protein